MNYFIMQTALLMVAAYLLGAALACGLRRLFFTKPAATAAATVGAAATTTAIGETEQADPGAANRFERALSGDNDADSAKSIASIETKPAQQPTTAAPEPTVKHIPAAASQGWAYMGDQDVYGRQQTPRTESRATIDADRLRTMHGTQERADYDKWTFEGEQAVYSPEDKIASATTAAISATAAVSSAEPSVAAIAPAPSDNLLKIRAIDTNAADILTAKGFTTYAQIADLKRADIDRISTDLGEHRRISRENWIEQAAMLANGNETVYARQFASGGLQLSAPTANVGEPLSLGQLAPAGIAAAAAAVSAVTTIARPTPLDDLTRIRGVDADAARLLGQDAVSSYSQIASWQRADIDRYASLLQTSPARISRENWIEQAALLTKGVDTDYSRRVGTVGLQLSSPTDHAGEPLVLTAVTSPIPAAATSAATLSPQATVAQPAPHDELQRIRGIDAETEKMLRDNGVTEYSQIAGLGRADVERIDTLFGSSGRVSRENWIEQAQLLAKGSQTSFARSFDNGLRTTPVIVSSAMSAPARPENLADAIRVNKDSERGLNIAQGATLTSTAAGQDQTLRSVRSEALRAQASDAGGQDDLKRIRGIGVLIEKKLNSLNVMRYEQIANWSDTDVAGINQALDFKGRVEREKWVEQARILASGGQTEFSRRIDHSDT